MVDPMRSDHADQDLETLAARAQARDRDAFRAFVHRTHGLVYQLALRTVGDATEAEDVVQDTYIRAWKALPGLRDHKAALGWLCRIARHVALDRLRYRRRRPEQPMDLATAEAVSQLADDKGDPHAAASTAETGELLRHAVTALPEKYRVVFLLREIDGMSYDDIAQVLGCPVGTVESRLHRARKRLARSLSRKLIAQAREGGTQ